MTVTKPAIYTALHRAQEDFQQLVAVLRPEDFNHPLGLGTWTIKQCFAHIARAELVHLRLARLSRRGLSLWVPTQIVPSVIHTFNRIQQAMLRDKTIDILIHEQQHGRAALLAFVERCTEAELARRCFQFHSQSWAPLSEFLVHVAEHQEHHVHDIRKTLQQHREA